MQIEAEEGAGIACFVACGAVAATTAWVCYGRRKQVKLIDQLTTGWAPAGAIWTVALGLLGADLIRQKPKPLDLKDNQAVKKYYENCTTCQQHVIGRWVQERQGKDKSELASEFFQTFGYERHPNAWGLDEIRIAVIQAIPDVEKFLIATDRPPGEKPQLEYPLLVYNPLNIKRGHATSVLLRKSQSIEELTKFLSDVESHWPDSPSSVYPFLPSVDRLQAAAVREYCGALNKEKQTTQEQVWDVVDEIDHTLLSIIEISRLFDILRRHGDPLQNLKTLLERLSPEATELKEWAVYEYCGLLKTKEEVNAVIQQIPHDLISCTAGPYLLKVLCNDLKEAMDIVEKQQPLPKFEGVDNDQLRSALSWTFRAHQHDNATH